MPTVLGTTRQRLAAHVRQRVDDWRTGSRASQLGVLVWLTLMAVLTLLVDENTPDVMPMTIWFVWLLFGVLLLRFGPLLVLSLFIFVCAVGSTDSHTARSTAGLGADSVEQAAFGTSGGSQRGSVGPTA